MGTEQDKRVTWIDREGATGEIFRIGKDVAFREGAKRLRVVACSTPDSDYRRSFVSAANVLAEAWGGAIDVVLDFSRAAPPGPGQAVGLCRDLHASGSVQRIVIRRHRGMPAWLLSAVSAILRRAGTPVEVEDSE